MSVNLSQTSHGMIHQGLRRFGDRVTSIHWQQNVIDDDIARMRVEAALRGEVVSEDVSFDQIVTRENNVLQIICDWADISYPGVDIVQKILHEVEAKWGAVTIHDRVVPAGLGLPQLFQALYGFNEWAKNEERWAPIKLYHEPNKEWWRTDMSVQYLPTELGVIRQDLSAVMQPTDLIGRPFSLNFTEQVAWAKERGGDDITSAEEVVYLFLRRAFEYGLPLWGVGSCRCSNACGSVESLDIYWDAVSGFRICRRDRDDRYWGLGALPRKSLAFGR